MLEKWKELFEFKNEQGPLGNYLVFTLREEQALISYQGEMLENNKTDGILNLDIRVKNGKTELWYDISLFETLNEYKKKNQIKAEQFTFFLETICSTMLNTSKFFLEESLFALESDFIFVDKDMKPQLLYLPVQGAQSNTAENFKQVLTETSPFVELKQGTGDMIQALTREAMSSSFNFRVFLDKIKSFTTASAVVGQNIKRTESAASAPKKSEGVRSPVAAVNAQPQQAKAVPQKKAESIKAEQKRSEVGVNEDLLKRSSTSEPKKSKKSKNSKGSNPKLIVMLIQVLLVIILAALYVNGLLESLDMMQLGGVIVIALAVDYLIARKVLQGAKEEKPKQQKKTAEAKGKPTEKVVKKREPSAPVRANEASETAFSGDEGTVIMEETFNTGAYLMDMSSGSNEISYINANPFVIGKSSQEAQLVNANKLISRRHAKIISENGQFFIADMGSTNGTMLNCSKLEVGLSYPLAGGDIITLAKYEYTFFADK